MRPVRQEAAKRAKSLRRHLSDLGHLKHAENFLVQLYGSSRLVAAEREVSAKFFDAPVRQEYQVQSTTTGRISSDSEAQSNIPKHGLYHGLTR